MMKRTTIYSAIAAFSLAMAANAEQTRFSDLPGSVQKTINRNLDGGIVQEIERKSDGGQTFYDVEIRRDGKNKHIRVNADGKLLPQDKLFDSGANVDVNVDTDRDIINKNESKILGVIDDPDVDADFKADSDDKSVKVEADVDKPRDRGVTEDVFDKNDGKILNVLPAPKKNDLDADVDADVDIDTDRDRKLETDVKIDTDDSKVVVDSNRGKGKGIFRKGDGKIIGIPKFWKQDRDEVAVTVDGNNRNEITTDVDGGLDTDKGDGRILGAPKRGFETLSLNEVPPVVRETIRREAGGYKVVEIERATHQGRGVYEVDIEREGKNRELHVAADGTILKDSDREAVGAPARNESGRSEKK